MLINEKTKSWLKAFLYYILVPFLGLDIGGITFMIITLWGMLLLEACLRHQLWSYTQQLRLKLDELKAKIDNG